MSFIQSFRKWFQRSRQNPIQSRITTADRRQKVRMAMENLEDRLAPAIYTNPGAILIPGAGSGPAPGSPSPSNIVVAGQSGTITHISMTYSNYSHTHTQDVDTLLVGPTGATFTPMSDAGITSIAGANITLDDNAVGTIPNAAFGTGAYRPTNYVGPVGVEPDAFSGAPAGPYNVPTPSGAATFGSVFNGTSANGNWALFVQDDAGGDIGSIAGGWRIAISTTTDFTYDAATNPGITDYTLLVTGVGGFLQIVETANYANVLAQQPYGGVTDINVLGQDGIADRLRVNFATFTGAGLAFPVNGLNFNAGLGGGADAMTLFGGSFGFGVSTPTSPTNGQVTYFGGATGNAIVRYTNLSPIDDTNIAPNFFILATPVGNTINVVNGPLVQPIPAGPIFQTLQVNSPSFELWNVANKTNLHVSGLQGSDVFNVNYTINGDGLNTLNLYGQSDTGVGDDASSDAFNLISNGGVSSTPNTNLFGQLGSDFFNNLATNNLDTLFGNISIFGGDAPNAPGINNVARLQDSNDASSDGPVTLTSTQLLGTAPAGNALVFTYDNSLTTLLYEGSNDADTIDILSTSAFTNYYVTGNGGSDTVTIGNTSAAVGIPSILGPSGTGNLDPIQGNILVSGEFNPAGPGDIDTLNVDDSGTVAGDVATLGINPTFTGYDLAPFGPTFSGPVTELIGMTTGIIRYAHTDTNYTPAGFNNRMEFFNLIGSQGNDDWTINATTATILSYLTPYLGDDVVTIGDTIGTNFADNLSANNLIQLSDGNDQITVNIQNNIGDTAFAPIQSLQIQGNNQAAGVAGDTANRDRVTINDFAAGFRFMNYNYGVGLGGVGVQGSVDVAAFIGGFGLFGGNAGGFLPLQLRSLETVIFNDIANANNDVIQVVGTTNDDLLTVGLRTNNTSALVFRNGDPYLNTPDVTIQDGSIPGLGGAAAAGDALDDQAPDMWINGLNGSIFLNGGGNVGEGDRAVVYGLSEDNLIDPVAQAAGTDIFGFGAGVFQQGAGAGNAYDSMNVSDGGVDTFNPAFGFLTSVTLNTPTFDQTSADSATQRAALTVNGGDEASFQPNNIADNITATISTLFNIQINGNLPGLTFAAPGPKLGQRQGDQLTINSPGGALNIFSDNATTPNVTVTSTSTGVFGVRNSSIERLTLNAFPNGIVNIIGDNNDPAVDQNDYFRVLGRDINGNGEGVNELQLEIGGNWDPATGAVDFSAPIFIDGVFRLNVMGGEAIGYDAFNNAIPNETNTGTDALEITAYADNTPRGWGVETYFNEGDDGVSPGGQPAPDLLIINGVLGVSENIVVQPSAPDAGQVFSSNAATGTPIAVVNYVLNSNIIVNGSSPAGTAGDTDNLFLRGTDPSAPGTSGLEDFFIDLQAAGIATDELVRVFDNASGLTLYNIQDFSNFNQLNIQTLGGSDYVRLERGELDGSVTLNVDGASPTGGGGAFDIDTVEVDGLDDLDDLFLYFAGATAGSGRLEVLQSGAFATTIVNVVNTEVIFIDGDTAATGGSTGTDTLTVLGTSQSDTYTLEGTGIGAGRVLLNGGPGITFFNLGSTSSDINLVSGAGNDSFSINPIAAWGIDTVSIDGGAPSASDSVSFTLDDTDDVVTYTPISANSATMTITNGGLTNYALDGVEHLSVDARGAAADAITIMTAGNFVNTPGQEAGSGVAVVYLGPGLSNGTLALNYRHFETVNYQGTTAIINGTAGNDIIVIDGTTGIVTVNGNAANYTGTPALVINALGGDDTITVISGGTFATINILGGDNGGGSDTVIAVGSIGDDVINVNLLTSTITGVAGIVTIDGIEHLVIDGNGAAVGDSVTVNDLGAVTGLASIAIEANNLADNVTVNGTTGPDILNYNPTDATSGQITRTGTATTVNYTGVDSGAGAVLTVGATVGGFDVLNVLGTQGADAVTSTATTVTRDGTVTVGAGIGRIDINTLGGNDTITLPALPNVSAAAVDVIVNAGEGNDTIDATGLAATIVYDFRGDSGDDIIRGGLAAGRLDGGEGNDFLDGNGGNDQMFGGAGSDVFTWEPGDGSDLIEGGEGNDVFIFTGAAGAEIFTLNAVGTRLEFLRNVGAIDMDIAGVEQVDLIALGGVDVVTINDLTQTDVRVLNINLGADGATDAVTVNGRALADNLLLSTPGLGQLLLAGLRYDVNFSGAESTDTLAINGNAGDDTITAAAGTSTVVTLTLNGGAGSDVLDASATSGTGVRLNGNDGNDRLLGGSGNDAMDGGAGDDTFAGNGGTDAIGGGAGSSVGDTILVEGTDGADTISLGLDAAGFLVATVNGLTTTYTNFLSGPIATSGIEQIKVVGKAGADGLTVDSTNGAISIPINFDGGEGADLVTLQGGIADGGDIYIPGENIGQGTSLITIGGVTQTVRFSSLEPVIDLVGGDLTVVAPNSSNAISFSGNVIAVDNLEVIIIGNKNNVSILGNGGSDTININNPFGLAGQINVDGGDPTGSDSLIVNGIAGVQDNILYTPTGAGSGTVAGAGPLVSFTGTEHLTLVGQTADNDGFGTIGTAGSDTYEVTPGPNPDSGRATGFVGGAGGFNFVPVTYSGFTAYTSFPIDSLVNTPDTLIVNGTAADDVFTYGESAASPGFDVITVNGSTPIFTSGATKILRGLSGNDTFNLTPGYTPLGRQIVIEGGDSDGLSDTINYVGAGSLVTIETDLQTITSAGVNPIQYSGIEHVNVDAVGAPVDINGSLDDDAFTVRPNDATGAEVTQEGIATVFQIDNTLDLEIDGDDGAGIFNRVTVIANSGDNVIAVSDTQVSIAGRLPVNLSDIQSLSVEGLAGNDTFNVTAGTIPIFIDGGNPIGPVGDILNLFVPAGSTATFQAGPEDDEGGFTFTNGVQTVSYDHIEAVNSVTFIGGAGELTICGTNADDDITVIATGPGAFTVSVNDGPTVAYAGVAILNIQAKAGDDDIDITPIPGWGVTVNVDGGEPTASDILTVTGTAGADAITHTPTGLGAATIDVNGDIINATTIEHFTYNGLAGGDALTIDTINIDGTQVLTPGAAFDSGTIDFRDNSFIDFIAGSVQFLGLGTGGSLTMLDTFLGGGRFDNLIYNGTNLDDVFVVDAAGVVLLNSQIPVNTPSVVTLTLAGLDGDDGFIIAGDHNLGTIVVQGGNPSASDTLIFVGSGGDVVIDLDGQFVQEGANGPVFFTGIETLNVDAGAGAITVLGRSIADAISVTPTSVTGATIVPAGLNLVIHTTNDVGSALTIDAELGGDAVTVHGTAGADTIDVDRDAGTVTVTDAAANVLKQITLDVADTETLVVDAGLGGDLIAVIGSFLAANPTISFVVNGGLPTTAADTLRVTDPFITVNFGVDPTSGLLNNTLNGDVNFLGIETLDLIGGGAGFLTVNGTNGNDQFNYDGDTVTVNNGAVVDFNGYFVLSLNGLNGNDNFTLVDPMASPNPVFVNVDGGNPPGSDHVLVVGTAANEAFTYTPTGFNSGTLVAVGAQVKVYSLIDVESLNVDGVDGGDTLAVNTTNATIVPGAAPGSGTVNPVDALSQPLLSLGYLHMQGGVSIVGGTVVIQGTSEDDTITVDAAGNVSVTNLFGFNNTVNLPGNPSLIINAIGGDDNITIAADAPFAAIRVIGGDNGTASDTLNYVGVGNDITVDTAARTISDGVGPVVSFTGVEHINVNAAGANVTFLGGVDDDDYLVKPDVSSVELTVDSLPGVSFRTNNVTDFTIDGQGGSNRVVVNGTDAGEVISINRAATTTVAVAGRQVISLVAANTAQLQVNALGGSDLINVTGGAVALFVDGGDPIGPVGDTLNVTVPAGAGTTTFAAGPESDEGGFSFSGVAASISYDHIEALAPIDLTPAGGVLIVCGTNGDDDITLVGTGPNSATISVNDGPAVAYVGLTAVTLQGKAGDDDIDITVNTLAITTINVEGNDPTASDTVTITGNAGQDTVNYSIGGPDSATFTGLATPINMTTTEHVVYNGLSGNDLLTVTTVGGFDEVTLTPGAAIDAGSVTVTSTASPVSAPSLAFLGLGSTGSVTFAESGGGSSDNLIYNGTALDDTFSVSALGVVELNNQIDVLTPGVVNLRLAGLNGDDTFNIAGNHILPSIRVEGGNPSASDVLNFNGSGGAITVDIAASTITEAGFGAVTFSGVERVNTNAGGANITFLGGADDDAFDVKPDASAAELTVDSLPNVFFRSFNINNFTVNGLGGANSVNVKGTDADNLIAVNRAATTTIAVAGRQIISIVTANAANISVQALAGNDIITVSGLFATATSLSIDGGGPNNSSGGNDRLIVNTATGTTTVSPGSTPDAGTVDVPAVGGLEDVQFAGMENLTINGTGVAGDTLITNGTHGNDTTTLQNLGGTNLVWLNDRAVIAFTGFGGITLSGRFGSDNFSVHSALIALVAGGSAITVNGNDPTASDSVIINGTAGLDNVVIDTLAIDGARVTGLGPVVNVNSTEHLTYSGLGGNDSLTVTTPVGIDVINVTPGAIAGDGRIDARRSNAAGGTALLPIAFTGVGATGSLTLADAGAVRVDVLTINGTEASNAIGVSAAGQVTVENLTSGGTITALIAVNTPGVDRLNLNGLGGDDVFAVPGNHPFINGIFVDAGDPSASDVLNFTGSGTSAVALNLGAATVTQAGFGAVTFSGVETLNVVANNALSVTATTTDDDLKVTVFSATSGRIENGPGVQKAGDVTNPGGLVTNYSAITGSLVVDLAGGVDTLFIVGNALNQTFNINDSAAPVVMPGYVVATPANTVTVDNDSNLSLEGSVTYTNTESLQVNGLEGNDTFQIAPAGLAEPLGSSIPIFIDGGDPVGTSAGDRITIVANGNPVMFEPGPESDEGGFVFGGNTARVSYDHIEAINPVVAATSIIIVGTNGDDDITVIARDASYAILLGIPVPAGLDGVRDFTVSVNGGPEVLYIDVGGVAPVIGQLHIDGLAGDDDIIIRAPAPNGAGWSMLVEVSGGAPSDGANNEGDRLVVETPGTNTVFFTPTGVDTGIIDLDLNGVAAVQVIGETRIVIGPIVNADPPIGYNSTQAPGIELFEYDGEGGNDVFTILGTAGADTITSTPGVSGDEGILQVNNLLAVHYQNMGTAPLNVNGQGANDTLVVDGTQNNDVYNVTATSVTIVGRLPINQISVENLTLRSLAGDDQFNIPGGTGYLTINIEAGSPSASDFVNLTGGAGVESVNIAPNTTNPTQQVVTGLGPVINISEAELIRYTGVGANDTLTVATGDGDNTVRVDGADTTLNIDAVHSNSLPLVQFSGLNTFVLNPGGGTDSVTFATFSLTGALPANYQMFSGFSDVLVIEGQDGGGTQNDSYLVTNPAGLPAVRVVDNNSLVVGVTVTETSGALARLQINTRGGNDSVTVNVGLTDVISVPITYDGGNGSDVLIVLGSPATPVDEVIYNVGPTANEGNLRYENAANATLMSISFLNLEPVIDLVPAATLTVNANNGNNAINYSQGSVATRGLVSVDTFETMEFNNKTNLVLNGNAGSDTFNLNNPNTPQGLQTITVNGGDPTTTDAVILNGTAGQNNVSIRPNAADGAIITEAGRPTINVNTTERFTYNGQGGDDNLTIDTFLIDGTQVLTPGTANDSGTVDFQNGGAFVASSIQFLNLGNAGSLTFADVDRFDNLIYRGTDINDTFTVTAGGAVTLNNRIVVNTPSILRLTLAGLNGDDTFNIPGNHNFLNGIEVQGGNPSASDVLNFTSSGGATTVDLQAGTVTETGFASVTYTEVELVNVNAAGGNLTVQATAGDDTLKVTPTGSNSATAQLTSATPAIGATPVVNAINIGTFDVDLRGGNDSLEVIGTQVADTVVVNSTQVAIATFETVNYTGAENLRVLGQAGNDTFNVTPAANTTIFIDGGDPIGSTPGDSINFTPAGAFQFEPGPENDEGGFVEVARQRVSWDHIEGLSVQGGGPGKVLGTNGDDDITIIARDASTHPVLAALTPGVRDFTVSVNGGVAILFIDQAQLFVDALSGDDDIVLRTPAPNLAIWDVDVFIAGGAPGASTVDQGDVFLLETPGTQSVIYTPNGIDTGTFDVVTLSSVITIATFICPVSGLPSSPGGVEQVIYQGFGGNDSLTVVATALADVIDFTPGTTRDSGDVVVNSLLPLHFQGLGNGGEVILTDGGGADTLVYHGTGSNDSFSVNVLAAGTIGLTNTAGVHIPVRVPTAVNFIESLTLDTLDGDDTIEITSSTTLFSGGIRVEAGDPSGSDITTLNGSAVADMIALTLGTASDTVDGVVAGPVILVGVENLIVNSLAGNDTLSVTNLGGTTDLDNVTFNSGGDAADVFSATGTDDDDTFTVTPLSATSAKITANDIGPVVTANLGLALTSTFTVNGNTGANNTVADMVIVKGTNGPDFVAVNGDALPNPTVVVENSAGTIFKAIALGLTIEEVTVQTGFGNDTIAVVPAPARVSSTTLVPGATIPTNLLINIDGGAPGSSDALVITSSSTTGAALPASDFVVINRGRTADEGVVRVYRNGIALPDITYTDVEIVSPLLPAPQPTDPTVDTNLLILGPDNNEQNETRANATFLGTGNVVNVVNQAIFPNAFENRFVVPDQDWFRVVAQRTGTIDFQVYFRGFNANGAASIPGGGDLELFAFDSTGDAINNPLSVFGLNENTALDANERLRIPVVAGQTYYFQVRGANNQVVNGYSISVLNEAAPVPVNLELEDVVVGGGSTPATQLSAAAGSTTTVFTAAASALLSSADGFYNGKYVHFLSGNVNGERGLVLSYVGATRTFTFTTALLAAPAAGSLFQIESGDTGRSQFDNHTRDTTPTIFFRLDDAEYLHDLPGNPADDTPPDQVTRIPFRDPSVASSLPGYRIAIYDEGSVPPQSSTAPQTPVGFASNVYNSFGVLQEGVYTYTFTTPLSEGSHFITARVQITDPANPLLTGFGARSEALEIVIDSQAPPVYFGLANVENDGLDPTDDTGIVVQPNPLFADRITNQRTPTFFGTAEANSVIRLYLDLNQNGTFEATDRLIAQTVATPIDGTNQFPGGRWVVKSNVDFNTLPAPLGQDGLRTLFVTAEDLAGNVNPATGQVIQQLQIFVDTQGPRVTGVIITGRPDFNLFGVKGTAEENAQGPTPLVNSLTISISDLPARVLQFLYDAFQSGVATTQGGYVVKGDHVGIVNIESIDFDLDPPVAGQPATGTITLNFDEPLPDDRYTLTIFDTAIIDPAGNILDGENDGQEPNNVVVFPSGDGNPGGNFVARFTVDSRPEIGAWVENRQTIDINGNGVWDPQNTGDQHNIDLTFRIGLLSDHIFAGNFTNGVNNGFDKLGAYGKEAGLFRFLLDFNADGITDSYIVSTRQINGTPVAGNFDNNPANGDEIGLFDGRTWYLDTNHNNNIDFGDRVIVTPWLRGVPIVGDFDGDGVFDLAAYQPDNNRFQFDLGGNGYFGVDRTLNFGFPGVGERPVAADMDQDGLTDVGLYLPGTLSTSSNTGASFYFLISDESHGGGPVYNRTAAHPNSQDIFKPYPLGPDLHYTFGNNHALPLVGNFDPPTARPAAVTPKLTITRTNVANSSLFADVALVGKNSSSALVSRYNAANGDMYWAGIVNRNNHFFVELRKRVRGVWTTLKSKEVTTGVGKLTFETKGGVQRVYFNNKLIVSAADKSLKKGFFGTQATVGTISKFRKA